MVILASETLLYIDAHTYTPLVVVQSCIDSSEGAETRNQNEEDRGDSSTGLCDVLRYNYASL